MRGSGIPNSIGLHGALRSLIGAACQRSLATNSLMLRFDFRESVKGRAYIWIDPPWRLTHDGRFVTSSDEWPIWDGVEKPEINRPPWEGWCAQLDPLNNTTLAEFKVSEPVPNIRMRFASGHEIETFGNSGDGCWWYYRDRITGEVFEAGAMGITFELGESADD
jgi:hypothetical protein